MLKVLIVDDEPFIREGLKCMVSWEGYGMEIKGLMSNGEEALQFIQKQMVDLIITDIKMPQMDGLRLMEKCKEYNYDILYIILSGYTDFEFVKKAAHLGIENYLVKPIDEAELNQTLQQVAEKLNQKFFRSKMIQEGADILRENLTFRWMSGNISAHELEERRSYLRFTPSPNNLVAIVKIRDRESGFLSEGKERAKMELAQQIRAYILTSDYAIPLVENSSTVNLIFPNADVRRNIVRKTLEHIGDMISADKHFSYLIAVGDIEEDSQMVYRSYNQAKFTLDNTVYHTLDQILNYQTVKESIGKYPQREYEKLLRFNDKVEWIDEKEIYQIVDDILTGFELTAGIKIETIQAFATIIISTIYNNIRTMKSVPEQEIQMLEQRIQEAYHIYCIEELSQWTKGMILCGLEASRQREKQYSDIIVKVQAYLQRNYNQDISIKTVADTFGMNSSYLGRLFREEAGSFLTDYLNILRLEKAKQLLVETMLPIRKIAEIAGYHNTNYFYTIFKRYIGVSPSEFRKNGVEIPDLFTSD